ncbi:MAG: hypothetical protein P8188_17010, partial [Gemmatimonadota bacterium]
REKRNAGDSTLRQQKLLRRILANTPQELLPAQDRPVRLDALSYADAQDLIHRLREAEIQPVPSEAQLKLIRRLLEELELDDEERVGILGDGGVEGLETTTQASRVIDELQRLHDERQPPSPRQKRFIDSLMDDAGLSQEEAAELVGVGSLDDLTGGREGSASRLIDELLERTGKTDD